MKVHDLSIFSDHCMISVKLKLFSEHCYDNEVKIRARGSMPFAPDRLVWSERSKVSYQEAFSSQVIQDKMNNVRKDVSSDKIDVDDLINNISDIILSADDMTLKRKSFRVKKKKSLEKLIKSGMTEIVIFC